MARNFVRYEPLANYFRGGPGNDGVGWYVASNNAPCGDYPTSPNSDGAKNYRAVPDPVVPLQSHL